ncbi:Spy/CpxP family protein refolding chaperone [Geothrix sp. 21YS21S-4]|uniref:Spy/CpxP family protein refolding chaperone n=1 Tax=Geothrix sp. 21YS21S-4 TaxID=3068889 RepID=UPI0027B97C1E|nr:Spy/CpxP family protein refolding chaperone [Geothrix sp. 21YS21S-4]
MRTPSHRPAALAVILSVIGLGLSAQAPEPGPRPEPGRSGPHVDPHMGFHPDFRALRELGLTDAQQAKVKAIHESHKSVFKAKGAAAEKAGKALHEALAGDSADDKALKSLHDQAAAAQFDLLLEHRAIRKEIVAVLTPEQKAQFDKLSKKGPGHGPRGPHGPVPRPEPSEPR